MNKIITFGAALLMISVLLAGKVKAADNYIYKSYSVPVKDSQGSVMGKVIIQREGNLLYTDYDFDSPADCKLKSITTNQHGRIFTYSVTSINGQTLHEYPNTYIAPRDAVLAFDVEGQAYRGSLQFSSKLKFDCNGSQTTAYASSVIHSYYLTPTLKPTLTPTPTPTVRPKYHSYQYHDSNYNPRSKWSAWDKAHYLWLKGIADRANGR